MNGPRDASSTFARSGIDMLVLGSSIVRKRREGDASGRLHAAGHRLEVAAELLAFFWARKLWWLIPMVSVLLMLGLVLVFADFSAIAPFVYTLF